ncbi:MAG TPA: right-handed parallel beta-helix repeat-containing protein [Actinomycetes bacterium]
MHPLVRAYHRGTPLHVPAAGLAVVALAVVLALVGLGLGASVAQAVGSTLYVDGANPGCSDATGSGTSPSQPYCHIKNAVGQPGWQTILVSSGTYSESVTIKGKNDGSAGAPLVVRAADGASVTVRGGTNGFAVSSSSYLTLQGFTVTATSGVGILVSGSSHITVAGNHVSYAGQPVDGLIAQGIKLSGTNDSLVQANTTDHNSDAGIQLVSGSTRDTIQSNESFANARGYNRAAPGIDLRSPGNSVLGNRTHDNEDSGIQTYTGGGDELIADNLTYFNGDHGIDDLGATGQRIIGNSVWWNYTAGINVEGTSTGATVENNVAVDNGYNVSPCITPPTGHTDCAGETRTRGDIRVDQYSTAGTTVNYNLTWLNNPPPPAVLYVWNTTSYTSLASFQKTGQGANDITQDPKWVSASGHDYHLTAGSPAIDSANAGVSGEQPADIDGNPRVDDPATPNDKGAPPGAFDDRGAYEFQPSGPPPPDSPPTAALSLMPSSGTAPLAVTADASGSSDTDATPISTYAFDFGDGTTPEPQAGATATHTYTGSGTFTVTVTVTDSAGQANQATASVSVSSATGGTNLINNPGFEAGLSGWNTAGSTSATLTRVAGGHNGAFAAKLTNTGSSTTSCTLNDSPNWITTTAASGGRYTGSLWVRADTAGASLKLRFREYNSSGTLLASPTTTVALSTAWQQVTVTDVPAAPGASTLDFNAYISSAPPGTCFYADDASITLG